MVFTLTVAECKKCGTLTTRSIVSKEYQERIQSLYPDRAKEPITKCAACGHSFKKQYHDYEYHDLLTESRDY